MYVCIYNYTSWTSKQCFVFFSFFIFIIIIFFFFCLILSRLQVFLILNIKKIVIHKMIPRAHVRVLQFDFIIYCRLTKKKGCNCRYWCQCSIEQRVRYQKRKSVSSILLSTTWSRRGMVSDASTFLLRRIFVFVQRVTLFYFQHLSTCQRWWDIWGRITRNGKNIT